MSLILNVITGEGFWILALMAFLAGMVRGFSGFAAVLVFMPVAAKMLPPYSALAALVSMDALSRLPLLPIAKDKGKMRDVLLLGLGAVVTVPIGVVLVGALGPEGFRYGLSLISVLLLLLLASEIRNSGRINDPILYGTGAITGLLAGVAGMPGVALVRLYVPKTRPKGVVRANITLYLLLCALLVLGMMYWRGNLDWASVAAGAVLVFPYLIGNIVGQRVFRKEMKQMFRFAAYAAVLLSVVISLPEFD
jgi:uncharacterized membrane protein YfcA